MLEYLFLGMILLWVIALSAGKSFDGFVHLLLIAAFVVFVIRYLSGKKLNI